MSLTYSCLQDLLIARNERTQQWQNDLFDQAVEFSEALKEKLSPPQEPIVLPTTSDTWLPFQLSEPVEAESQPTIRAPLSKPGFEKYITKGALNFSIVLSFEENHTQLLYRLQLCCAI